MKSMAAEKPPIATTNVSLLFTSKASALNWRLATMRTAKEASADSSRRCTAVTWHLDLLEELSGSAFTSLADGEGESSERVTSMP